VYTYLSRREFIEADDELYAVVPGPKLADHTRNGAARPAEAAE
jgi:hypothetical protein